MPRGTADDEGDSEGDADASPFEGNSARDKQGEHQAQRQRNSQHRRTQAKRNAQEASCAAVLFDQRTHIQPSPFAHADAQVAIRAEPVVYLDGARRARRAQQARQFGEQSIRRDPRLAPEALLRSAADQETRRCKDVGQPRDRSLPRQTHRACRVNRLRGRPLPADASRKTRQRLKEVQPRDEHSMTDAARDAAHARNAIEIRAPAKPQAARNGREPAENACQSSDHGQPDVAAGERRCARNESERREHLPCGRMRQQLRWMHVVE